MREGSAPEIQQQGNLQPDILVNTLEALQDLFEEGILLKITETKDDPAIEKMVTDIFESLPELFKLIGRENLLEISRDTIHILKNKASLKTQNNKAQVWGYYEPLAKDIVVLLNDEYFSQQKENMLEETRNSKHPLLEATTLADAQFGRSNKWDALYVESGKPSLGEFITPGDTEAVKGAKVRSFARHAFISEYVDKNNDTINLEFDKVAKFAVAHVLIHEILHYQSKNKIIIGKSFIDEAEQIYMPGSRSGYEIDTITDASETRQSLVSFNEALTEMMAVQLLDEFARKHDLQPDIFIGPNGKDTLSGMHHQIRTAAYHGDRKLLGIISQYCGKSFWDNITEGYFNGNMMHLRSIEQAYGAGALRLYASLPTMHDLDQKIQNVIFDFFSAPSKEKLHNLSELLSNMEETKMHHPKIKRTIEQF